MEGICSISAADEEDVEDIYEEIDKAIGELKIEMTMVTGDFNS